MARFRKVLWGIVLIILLFAVVELPLRWIMPAMGYTIGSLAPNWQPVAQVDSLIIYDSYLADSLGIVRANPIFWQKEGITINEDGFRSPPFEPGDSGEVSILLLGDSFTWGTQAEPLDNSFADLLDAKPGVRVYNTGIPGADPVQYHALAQQYIPTLQPDHVVVCFYTANDLMMEDRPLQPYTPDYFVTNMGWLPAYYEGHHFATAEESYAYYQQKYLPQNLLTKALGHTATGTLLMSLPYRWEEKQQWEERLLNNLSYNYLARIRQLCQQHGATFTVAVIPDMNIDLPKGYADKPMTYLTATYPVTFKGLAESTLPLQVNSADYVPPPNGHFNNTGHQKAAQQIWQYLQNSGR